MDKYVNEKISQFIDNELGASEAIRVLEKVEDDGCFEGKLRRYHYIRKLIRTELPISVDIDFVSQVNSRLQSEPELALPFWRHFKGEQVLTVALVTVMTLVLVFW